MPDPGTEPVVHEGTLRASVRLFVLFVVLSVALWLGMPEEYPVRFRLAGEATTTTGPGMWILLVALCAISFGQGYLFQRFLITDPDSTLVNWPYRERFHRLPRERKLPVARRGNRLMGFVNIGLVLTFLVILLMIYYTAHNPDSAATRVSRWTFWLVLVLVTVTPIAEAYALRRMVRRKLVEEGLLEGGR